jgi:hypothetical protein
MISCINSKALIWGLVAFFISLYLHSFFVGGDQLGYQYFYSEMSNYPANEIGYRIYNEILGAYEPLYYLFVRFSSLFLQKELIFSILNALIAYYFAIWCVKKRINLLIAFIIFFTNFYVLVLFFSAERLKLACLVLLFLDHLNSTRQLQNLAITSLFHFQFGILCIGKALSDISSRQYFKNIINNFILLFLIIFLIIIYMEPLLEKFNFYTSRERSNLFIDVMKPGLFLVATLFVAPRKKIKGVLLLSIPLVILSSLVGSDRLTIFAYFIFMFWGLQKNSGINFWVLVGSLYFSYKGYVFIMNGIETGDGFSN